jgi:ADP-ribose pyrophosphatase
MGVRSRTVSSRHVYTGKAVRVRVDTVRLGDGRQAEREVVERSAAAAMVALDEEQRVYLVRQDRPAAGEALLELPAGLLDAGELPEACASRELAEEVGLEAGLVEPLAAYFSSAGFTDEVVHLYLGRQLHPVSGHELDPGEELEVVNVDLTEALRMVGAGDIKDAKTVIGLLLVAGRLRRDGPPPVRS